MQRQESLRRGEAEPGGNGTVGRINFFEGLFRVSERDLLLSTVTKVGKNTGRNLRFLPLPARYTMYEIVIAYRTFT